MVSVGRKQRSAASQTMVQVHGLASRMPGVFHESDLRKSSHLSKFDSKNRVGVDFWR